MTSIKNRKDVSVSKRRWVAYAAAGAAATVIGTQTAEADITHIVVGSPGGDIDFGDNQYFGLEGAAGLQIFDFSNATNPGEGFAGLAVYQGGVQFGNVVGFANGAGNFAYASNLTPGANVSTANFLAGSHGTMADGVGFANSQFLSAGDGYLAFRFDQVAGGTNWQYGWTRVTMAGVQPANEFIVQEYAYGDVGESISVGQVAQVPEPGSLGALALGALGLLASRRRKTTK